jgi:hypothetical protein
MRLKLIALDFQICDPETNFSKTMPFDFKIGVLKSRVWRYGLGPENSSKVADLRGAGYSGKLLCT